MSYEIQKVANGFMIRPSRSYAEHPGVMTALNEIYVFATLELVHEFLREKMGK